jgi:hypothetical protein
MILSDLNYDVYDTLEESVMDSIKRFVKSGYMKAQTINVMVANATLQTIEKALRGIDGIVVSEDDDKVKVAVSVDREAQFKTILNKIRSTEGTIVSVTP